MKFFDIVQPEHIALLESKNKNDVLIELIDLIANSGEIEDIESVKDAIFHREQLMSTGIGLGIAIPHIRIEGVSKPIIAVGISKDGISDYESIDGQPVKIIFMIVAGKEQHKEYITLLSQIVAKLKSDDVREKLISSRSSEEIYRILTES